MNYNNQHDFKQEEQEYNQFMLKWINKAREINDDFQKLSLQNQARVNKTIQDGTKTAAFMKILDSTNWH